MLIPRTRLRGHIDGFSLEELAAADLSLDRIFVVYPGAKRYRLNANIEALPLSMAPQL
jgi:hypothetical protein